MKVSLNWLREFVEPPTTVPALVDLLTLAGVEVEGVETRGCAIDNVVVAQILESSQHPNADRLSVCRVDDGSGTPRQIVCGAKNYKVGDKVPLALPGAVLPGDFKIKVGKLRGVESQGMLCSGKELALDGDAEGLLILPQDAQIGAPIGELYPGDTVLDLEITPNRPDLLSMNGLAREIAALTGAAAKLHAGSYEETVPLEIEVRTPASPYYTARHIRGVKVHRSPAWLRQRLEAIGLRPINNVVDVCNYVMFGLGQPLHAFDAAKLRGAINVRQAQEGEQFGALDGRTYTLTPDQMVIADSERAVAIAGVMGGQESGVTESTTEVLLESAQFEPRSIRRTSQQLGLSSDSSYRFERGVDAAEVIRASQRAAALIVELAGGEIGEIRGGMPPGTSIDESIEAGGDYFHLRTVPLRFDRLQKLLGTKVSDERVAKILTALGLEPREAAWGIPSFRSDLTREVDLIEEVARVVGMDAIPPRMQARFAAASATDRAYDRAMTLRRACAAQGLHEARSLALVPAEPLGLACTQTDRESLQRVRNPMIEDQVVLRPNLLHGLFKAVADNARAGAESMRLFEIGRVYSTQGAEEFPHFALVMSGPAVERSWRSGDRPAADLFDLKGIVASLFSPRTEFAAKANPALAVSLSVSLNGRSAGFAGQLWPKDARALDATAPVFFAEIDLAALDATARDGVQRYREIPRFPAVTRDIALLAPLHLPHAQIAETLQSASEPLLAHIELFDVFNDAAGTRIPADKRSLAYSLTYRAPDRTLTADEVNAAHARLKERLRTSLGVTLRE